MELAPERGDVHQRRPVEPRGLHEQVPIARAHRPAAGCQAASVDQHRHAQTGGEAHDWKDRVERQAAPHSNLIGLPVVDIEGVVDSLFLPEALGHHDAADRLLNLSVDLGRHPAGLLRDSARHSPEAECDGDREGRHAQQQQGQRDVDGEEPCGEDDDQQHLAEQIHDQGDDGGEVLCVGSDPADDSARGMLVVERQIVVDGGVEDILSQLEHHIAYDLGGGHASDVVEDPAGNAQQQHPRGHDQHGLGRRVDRQHVNASRDEDWPAGAGR